MKAIMVEGMQKGFFTYEILKVKSFPGDALD